MAPCTAAEARVHLKVILAPYGDYFYAGMHYFQPLPGQDPPTTAPNRLCHSTPSRPTTGTLVLIQSSYRNDVNHSNFTDGVCGGNAFERSAMASTQGVRLVRPIVAHLSWP